MLQPSHDQELVAWLERQWGFPGGIASQNFAERCRYDDEGHLIALDLTFRHISFLPPEMGQLRHLRTLRLWGSLSSVPPGQVPGALPAEIGLLTALETLDLRRNTLSTLPAEITQLTQLHTLALGENDFRSFPRELLHLPALCKLFLQGNRWNRTGLSALPPEIGLLSTLEVLDLEENHLTELPAEIGQVRRLKSLNLRSNQLSQLPSEIGQLAALRELYLGYNHLTTLPATIGQLKELEILYLHDNQLTHLPQELEYLTRLRDLALENNPLVQVMRSWLPLRFETLTSPVGQVPPQVPAIEFGVELGEGRGGFILEEGEEDASGERVWHPVFTGAVPPWLLLETEEIQVGEEIEEAVKWFIVLSPSGQRVDVHLEAWTHEPPRRLDPWDEPLEMTLHQASGCISLGDIEGSINNCLFSFGTEPWDYQVRIYRRSRPDLFAILEQSFEESSSSPHHLERYLFQFWPA
jgi:hypothetical protein